jgi:hypothetical protein
MSSSCPTKPSVNFLVIGAQKTGTTALHQLLRQHEHLYLPKKKELHFFDNDIAVNWDRPSYSRYENLFLDKMTGQQAGEVTPISCYWQRCIDRIYRYNPSMKLILCIRNPADRAFSHWTMERKRNIESLGFSECIRHAKTSEAIGFDVGLDSDRFRNYVKRGYYARQIRNVLKHFPKHQLLVLDYSEFLSNVHGFLDTICQFLCVPNFLIYPSNHKIRVSNYSSFCEMHLDDRRYLQTVFEKDVQDTQILTGLNLSYWLK